MSSSEKLNVGRTSNVPCLDSGTESSVIGLTIDITLEWHPLIGLGVARITLMVPRDGFEADSLWYADPA